MKNKGVYFGLSAYVWGLVTLYWKIIVGVSPLATMCYRIVVLCFYGVVYRAFRGNAIFTRSASAVEEQSICWTDRLASVLISINWFIFAVSAGHVMQASRLLHQSASQCLVSNRFWRNDLVVLACWRVCWQVSGWSYYRSNRNDSLCLTDPWPFPLVRMAWSKRIPISSVTGLTIETMVIFPLRSCIF